MKNRIKIALYTMITMMAVPAFAAEKDASSIVTRLISLFNDVTSLLAIIMILFGMFSIFKLIQIFINREDGNRDHPMKNAPYYFIGAALGLGSAMMSDVVQNTILGETNDNVTGDTWKSKD